MGQIVAVQARKIPSATAPRLAAGRDAHKGETPSAHHERQPQSPPRAQREIAHHSRASELRTRAVWPSAERSSTARPLSGASPG